MTTKPKTRKAPAAEVAAPSRDSKEDYATIEKWQPAEDDNALMVKAAETGNDAVADTRHLDELDRMKWRLYGLEAAVVGAEMDCNEGLSQLFSDVISHMERCVDAFKAVRQIRLARRGTEAA
jgi:hypothetical protein